MATTSKKKPAKKAKVPARNNSKRVASTTTGRTRTRKSTAKPATVKKTAGKTSAAKASSGRPRQGKTGKVTEPTRSAPAKAEVDADVLEFIAAIDRFKQENGRPFPSWSEVLLVVRKLGYKR